MLSTAWASGFVHIRVRNAAPRPSVDRHDGIIVLRETESGQFILRTNLHRTDPPNEQPGSKRTELDLVEFDGVENTALGLFTIEPVAANKAILPHALKESSTAACNGIYEPARTACHCLPDCKFAIHQSSGPPVKGLPASSRNDWSRCEPNSWEWVTNSRVQDLTQQWEIPRLVELKGAFRIPHRSSHPYADSN